MKQSINEFLSQNIHVLQEEIISKLATDFDSHAFLKLFAKRFEVQYIKFLHEKGDKSPFQTVHSQIARFLSENQIDLKIIKIGKVKSEDVFGDICDNEGWQKR